MKLRLWVSCDAGDDLDLFVGLRKFDRRGHELHFPDFNHIEHGLVAKGWLRASHRELDEQRSTPYQPWLKHQRALKLAPGEIVPVEIEIWPSSTLFRKGETLRSTVQGGDFSYTKSNPLPVKHGRIPVATRRRSIAAGMSSMRAASTTRICWCRSFRRAFDARRARARPEWLGPVFS